MQCNWCYSCLYNLLCRRFLFFSFNKDIQIIFVIVLRLFDLNSTFMLHGVQLFRLSIGMISGIIAFIYIFY
ncbi:hypothetical protein VIGAN_02190100, partial [Vigna angularis var. angularis]